MIEAGQTPHGPRLDVDLAAIRANYRTLRSRYSGRVLSAVVKSDAYGLGLVPVSQALASAGCTSFWVNDLEEAVRLRAALPDVSIYALFGLGPYRPAEFRAAGIIPVLSGADDLRGCVAEADRLGRPMPAAIQLDTGLGRLGLTETEVDGLATRPDWLDRLDIRCWVTHLAAYDLPAAPANRQQRATLIAWVERLRPAPISLAASSALFMGTDWHFDIARAGSALFGIQTSIRRQGGLAPCYRLSAPVLRATTLPAGSRVGYRGVTGLDRDSRIATVHLGYANGVPQAFADFGTARFATAQFRTEIAPFVGGLSMNLAMLDVTGLDPDLVAPGARCVVFDAAAPLEDAALRLGCAPNALLTLIGGHTPRHYVAADPNTDALDLDLAQETCGRVDAA